MTTINDLLADIFGSPRPPLATEFEGWVSDSRRFRAFATQYRVKIRAKLKNARDENNQQDLRAELKTAALLLHDERFVLEYETYAASKQRGPDFTVTFRTHTRFNIEVRRLRSAELNDEDTDARIGKLRAVIGDKVGQMPPGIMNVLWLVAEREITGADLTHAMTNLRQLAERKSEDYFTRRGFASAADFLRRDPRLSGIVVYQSGRLQFWANATARHRVPAEIVTALQRLEQP